MSARRYAVSAAPAPVAALWELAAGPRAIDAALLGSQVTGLCEHMLWLRSWWEHYGDAVMAVDRKAASEAHDHFTDGACFARLTARHMGLDVDERPIRDYRWGAAAQTLRVIVVPAGIKRGAA